MNAQCLLFRLDLKYWVLVYHFVFKTGGPMSGQCFGEISLNKFQALRLAHLSISGGGQVPPSPLKLKSLAIFWVGKK